MNHHTHRTIYNRSRGCLMAVAETAMSSGKASGGARQRRSSKSTTPTCRKARSALSLGDMWLQANHSMAYGLPCLQSLNLGAATTGESLKFEFGVDDKGRNLGRQYINQSTQTGTSIQTGGNLNLNANQNIQGTAASIQSNGTVNLGAGGNIVLAEGRTTKSEDLNWLETRKDLTSSTTKRTSSTSDQSTAITTNISGNNGVNLQSAAGTLLLSGANVSSQNGNVALTGAEVIIASTQNGQNNTRTIDEKKTGASLGDLAGIATFGVIAPIANAGRGINAQSKEGAMAGDTTLVQTSITGQNVQVTSTGTGTNASVGGNISLKAAALNATGTGSAAGTVNLDAGTNQQPSRHGVGGETCQRSCAKQTIT